MLATNERAYPPYMCSNKLRAYRHVPLIALLLLVLCVAAAVPALAQVSGQNVNMVSGTNWTNGDPFLQRQNEPSIAVSSRNSSHLLAGANDYRTVDLPGLLGIDERGDAWLGLFKSFDGGRTWQSTLLPGFPLDGSLQGQASPIHGFQAASDPVVRAGTNGLFYYTGLAFNRGNNPPSTIFVSRFIDLNNKENGDAAFESGSMTNLQPRDTIKYVDTTIVDHATPETFLDKPWVAVDIPRQGATCTFSVNEDGQTVTQTIPAGQVYLTYTKFVGSGQSQVSTIVFKKSHDCGATWSSPRILSQNDESSGDAEHQGTVIAIDPSVPPSEPATVYVAWRRFASVNDPGDPPAIFLAKSVDGGVQWGTPFPVVVFPNSCIPTVQNPNPTGVGCPFDQVFTNASFRSNGYPALTVDSFGRVYVAWSQRDANGDGKIMMGIAPGGRSIQSGSIAQVDLGPVIDDNGNAFSNLSGRGSQLMPTLSFAAGKLMLAYYDLRQDHTTGTFVEAPNPNCDPVVTLPCALGAQYLESRTLEGEISPPNPSNSPSVFGPYVADSAPPLTARRHTIDVMGAEAVPPPSSSLQPPSFKAFRITNYLFGSIPQLFQDVEQIQFNAPNLPLFVDGTAPFMGDYIDVSGTPQIIPDGKGGWTFNTNPSANPVFHASWTDNRDVVPPADGNWRNYTPPISASNPGSQPSKFDPTQQPLACVVGQTGMRNQNVYTAEISQGVILTSPQTSKPVLTPGGQPIQRAFVVEVRNATNAARSFQVSIPSQPATATASFQQFGSLTTQTVKVNAFSSQSLPVFVVANAGSTFAFPSVLVTATENDGANPPLTGSVLLNPDPTNPALTGPDNAAIGGSQIAVNEFYNPGVANPGVANSGVASPGVANPGVANPGVANPGVANPTVVLALNPGVANPGVANPGVANPGVANPGVANESVTDASYTFTNEGNTSAAYTIQFFQSAPFPAGAKFQIILSKVYFTEQAVGCQIQQVGSNVIVANVTNPVFVTDLTQLGNPGVANLGVQTPTINLAPGDSGQVTIRTNLSVAQVESQVLPNVSPVAVSQAVNTVDVQNGIFTPPINLLITSTPGSMPLGVVNQPYNTSLTSIGGNTGLRNWTIASGSLPPGLQLNAASGAITGTPTQAGSFPFTAQLMDTGTPQHTATRALTITVVNPVLVTTPSPTLASGVVGSVYTQSFSAGGGVPPYTWSSTGTLPTGLALSSSGTLSGVPTTPGTYSFTVKATDSVGLFATAAYTIVVTNVTVQPAQITFVVQPSNAVGSQAISPAVQVQVFDAAGAVIPGAQVAMNFGNAACSTAVLSGSPLATTNASGIATFSNLVIDRGQNNYTLAATAGNATASSNPFTVSGFCPTGSLSTARGSSNTSTLLPNGKVLIIGGAMTSGAGIASAEIYDPSTGVFAQTGSMGTARSFHTATFLPTGKVLVTGGQGSASASTTAELYDPATGLFTPTGTMNVGHDAHTATLLTNGKVLIAGGFNQTAELYDPTTGVFTVTGSTTSIRVENTGTLLANGKVLLTGGGGANGPLATAEIYDPGLGTFTATGSMSVPREAHAATLLPNGKVLVSGGLTAFNPTVVTASADLFDPANGTFVPTGSLKSPQAFQAQTLLTDGEVLMTAGVNAELYDSTTGLFSATGGTSGSHAQTPPTLLNNGTILVAGGNAGSVLAELYYSTAPLAPMAITTTALANASTGQPYTQILLEQGGVGTLTWTETGSLPAGMSLSNQGVLSGTPTVAGSFPLTFTVTDSSNPAKSASSNFTLAVANTPLVFTSFTMPTAVAGKPYTQTLPVAGGTQPYNGTVTIGTPPPGLTLVGNVLTGTPSGTGTFTFTVTVTDSSTPTQTATRTLTIAVNTLVITTTALPSGIVGVPYNAAISTTGGTPPLSYSLATAAFPPGLSIQQGALAGTPTQAGNFFFSETVVDSSTPAQTATQNYEVTIAPLGTPAPANVTFVSQPQNSVGGQTLSGGSVVVRVTDASNNPIPGTTVAMTLGGPFHTPPACSVATLSGTLTAVTDATGQVTFSNLSVDRGGFNYALLASTGSASQNSGPFSVQGFCASGNLSTQREGHTQDLLGTAQSTFKFRLDPKGTYLFTNTNPAPPGVPDIPDAPLIIPLASLGIQPGNVISGMAVGDMADCAVGSFCFGEVFNQFTCAVFSTSNTLLSTGGTINRVPGAITPDFTTAFPCSTPTTLNGNLPTDIPQDFALFGERVIVPPGAAYLFVGVIDTFYSDNSDPNGDFGVEITVNSPTGVNRNVLIAGGADNSGNVLNTAELYHPLLGFSSPTGNLTAPNGRANHVSVVLPNGQVLLIGGLDNAGGALATAELYNPATGTFAATGSMSRPRTGTAAVLLADGRVLVSGGFNTSVATNTAEIYDPATGLWTPTGNMNQGRARHAMTLLPNGKVLVTGGRDTEFNFNSLASAEIFDPFANQGAGAFSAIGNMNSPRFKHTATLLSNGKVLIAGGFNDGNNSLSVASAELFDPNTNTFTPTGSMNIPRARHSSTLLPDGTVLETGAINGFNGLVAAAPAELYSPATGTFALTAQMITGREVADATLIPPNGNVLISGGDDGVNVLASTEVYYNPVAQTPVVITTTSVPNGFISQPYVQLLLEQNRSGPITWSLASGTLPPGITLSASGILFGTPTAVGSFTFSVQVTDGISTATTSYTINVSLSPLTFTSNTMPAAGSGKAYSQPLPVTGGTLPHTATLTAGTLPPGLALSTNGLITGTPSSAGSFTFTVNVTDSSTPAQSATQTLTIAVDTLFIVTTALPDGIIGVPYNAAISTVGGSLPLSFSLTSAAFPPGLAIQQPAVNSQSGALAGTPTLAGHYTFSETVVDSSSPAQTATQIYILDVLPAGTAIPAALTFTRQPQNSIGGQILGGSPVRVLVTDANNAPIVGASVAISFNGAPPCSTAVLSGTLTAITNGNGNAFFPDLSIDRGQLGYTLLASAGSATAVSLPFTVNGFCPTGDLTVARRYATATVLPSGKVLVTGGDPANGVNGSSSSELFDPTSGTFTLSGLMSNARAGHDATLLNNGQVLITGGRGPGGVGPGGNLASAELYNPTTGLFSPTGGMSTARYSPTSTLLADGRVLITGGDPGNNIFTNSAELYDPASGTFSQTGNLTVARGFHTAILLPDGKVLIAGGRDSSGPLSSVEIYDPVSGISNFAGNMSTPRSFHTATLLSNGKVLLAGGQTSSTGLASAELFDPATGTFSLTGSMLSASVESNANLLADGTALISDGFVFPSGISEIYDPSLGVFSATGNQVNGRIGNGAAVLANGQVLLTGGATPGPPTNPILNSAEIYYSTAPLAPISITTTSPLFSANVGTPFTQILLEQGGLGNLTWSETGTLPAGVTFSPQGVLSGTPTTTGSFPLTFTVTDSSTPTKTASRNFILTVTSGPVVLVITTSTLPGGTANTPYAANISSTGGVLPIGFAVTSGALPPGLSLALAATPPQTATLSGTPTTTGTFTFVVTATDASSPAATASASYTVTIAPLVVSSLVVQHSSPSIPVGSVQQFLALVTLPNGTTQNLTTSVTWSSSDTTKVTINNASGSQGFATAIASGTVTITANLNGVSGSAVLNVVSTPSAVTQFAYVANRTDNTISVDALSSAGGGLSPILGSPFAAGITAPNGLAVDPTARFLYVSTFGGPSLSGLAINGTTGALSPIPGSPFTQGSNPIFLAVDPTGRFVYTANLGSDNVSVFSIDSNTGALAATSGSPFPAGSQPHGVTIDPKGRFAYVANCGSGQGCTGTGSGSITGYALNSVTGAMTPVPGSPFLAGLNPFAVTVDPTGKFVYVANTSSSSVSAFTIDPNSGTLSALAGSPFQVGTQPGALTVDRAGKLLYVANGGSLNISGFTISPIDGSLTPIPGSPFQLGRIPTSVAVDATNQFLYASELGGVVEGFSINPATGALSSLGGFGVGNGSAFITTTEPPAITITLTLLRNASQNQPYNEVLLEQGGVGTLTWTLVANSSPLPPGLTLSSSGIISGTPTQFGAFPITVQVTDSSVPAKSATITYGLIVLPQLQFLGNQLVTAFSGTPYNNSLPLVGGTAPYTITLTMGTLPAGLVFTPASSTFPTGQISGTTTVVGNYTLTFQATDSSVPPQSTTGTLTLGVTTPLTITTTTLPNGSLGASYSAAISTTGGIGTVTFVPPSGARPPGVTIGYQGVLSGIPTSTGTFAFTVLGFDQSFPPQTASQTYTLTITTAVAPIVLSPDPLNLLANSSGTMSVTLSAAAGASGQAITLSSSNSSVASVPGSVTVLPQATTATFQVTAGTSTSNATVTASAAGFTSGNASVVVVGCPSSVNLTLCGRYSMGVVGFNSSGGPVAGGVTFVADNSGHIVSGIMKFNQSVAGPTTSTITGGSYVIDSSGDGRGVLTLTDSTSTSRTYRFVLESLANAGAAQVEEFDNSGTLVSGIIAGPETPPVPQIPPNTTVALNVKGINGSGQLAALLGEFQVGSGGCDGTAGSFNSLAGEPIVTNTAGTVNTALTATGSCTASDPNTGIGTAQITISGGTPFTNSTLNFVYVAVGTGTTLEGVFFLEVDPIAANQPILSGLAESVSVPAGGFNASTPVGCPCLLVQSGTTDGTTTTGHSVASIVRVQTTPGAGASGTLTGVLDQNAGGTITLAGAWPYTSYTVDSNGVGTVTGTGSPVHFIISGSGGNGFTVLTVDESVSVLTGSLRSQNATTIQTAGAPYIVGLGNGDFVGANRNVESAVGVITPSGTTSGTLTGTVDVISSAGSVVGATASGTYTIDSTTGRGTGTANLTGGTSSIPVVIYARRVRQFVVLDVQSSDPYLFGARLQ